MSNCTDSNTVYMSGYDSNHLIENILIKDYFINGQKMRDAGSIGKNEFVQNVSLE